ncbi:MAG: hypothetical protein WAJ93_17085, partial [Candidatus Nitrosopolaris sp.]
KQEEPAVPNLILLVLASTYTKIEIKRLEILFYCYSLYHLRRIEAHYVRRVCSLSSDIKSV